MHPNFRFVFLTVAMTSAAIPAVAQAELVGITAEEAFDAVQTQTDPLTGADAKVALVDVRTRAEYSWVGTAAKVNKITLQDAKSWPIVPDLGKVKLVDEGKFLEYAVNGRHKRTQVAKVASLDTSPIAINVPYKLWDETTATTPLNPEFGHDIDALAEAGAEVLIVYCRSGSRSSTCGTQIDNEGNFQAVYEIDDPVPGSAGGVGGFEGSPYGEVYNGYHGFPGRLTDVQSVPSVSWKDTGLPIKIGVDPLKDAPPLPWNK
jgi:rhodanese-related sulfurtransferase